MDLGHLIERYKQKDLRLAYIHAEYVTMLRAAIGIPDDREPKRMRYLNDSGQMTIPFELYIEGMLNRIKTLCPDLEIDYVAFQAKLVDKAMYCAPEVLHVNLRDAFKEFIYA